VPAQLRQTLTTAGFKDIQIVQAGFLVRGETQDGGQVVALLNLDRATAGAGASGSSTSGSSSSGSNGASGSSGSSGSSSGTNYP